MQLQLFSISSLTPHCSPTKNLYCASLQLYQEESKQFAEAGAVGGVEDPWAKQRVEARVEARAVEPMPVHEQEEAMKGEHPVLYMRVEGGSVVNKRDQNKVRCVWGLGRH